MVEALSAQIESVMSGDLSRGEAMLVAQAHTLDAIFNHLAQLAVKAHGTHCEMLLRLALRAQNHARMTWETIAAIKNPPRVSIVRQTNIAGGAQQVNNGNTRRVSELAAPPIQQNELLETSDDQRLVPGAQAAAIDRDSSLEALADGNRPTDCLREGTVIPQRGSRKPSRGTAAPR
jgi:hypothetical protein